MAEFVVSCSDEMMSVVTSEKLELYLTTERT